VRYRFAKEFQSVTTFYLIRHGKADWDDCYARGLSGFRTDFTKLTTLGKDQLENTAKIERLTKASLILSSPYTRALQSAAILSRNLQTKIEIEYDLHEWLPDTTGVYSSQLEIFGLADDFERHHGIYPIGETRRWETLEHLKARVSGVLQRYLQFDFVIVVCHEMAIWSVTGTRDVANGQVIELEL
jgi:broad specificity phosphatase PhoE